MLDGDRFYGKFREGAHKVDVSDMMRRMVKEELLKFDGTPLFPERRAYTANYELSSLEAGLYEQVTTYVREEMNRADNLDGQKKNNVGFALTMLQRRLASSPEAIYQSLKRRRRRLEDRLEETKLLARGQAVNQRLAETVGLVSLNRRLDLPDDLDELDEDLSAEDFEAVAEQVVDQASAAATVPELEAEILSLKDLEYQASQVVQSGNDKKWEELSVLLQDSPEMFNASGGRRKLIIFTEHKDTLLYLVTELATCLAIPMLFARSTAVRIVMRAARFKRNFVMTPRLSCWSLRMPQVRVSTSRTPILWSITISPGIQIDSSRDLVESTELVKRKFVTSGISWPLKPERGRFSKSFSTRLK